MRRSVEIQKNSDYNQLPNDIRMDKIQLKDALDFLNNLKNQWIYIKYLNMNKNKKDANLYAKFKIKDIIRNDESVQLYGNEDKDNLYIDIDRITQTEMNDTHDEIRLVLQDVDFLTQIYIKKYFPNAKNRYDEVLNTDQHIIVTEGKTDWKILKKALEYFQMNGRYTNLDVTFFEFEDDISMGETKAYTICEYNALFPNKKMRIFIFDSDVQEINEKHKNMKYKEHGNNVYSFTLPVPDFRKNTPLISIENYFTDEEIMTKDNEGRRLYLVKEFDLKTGKHKSLDYVYALVGKDKKPNQILDQKVYKIEGQIHDKSEIVENKSKKNIALSKNSFADNICNEIEDFKNISLERFSLVFDIVEEIFEKKDKINEKEISKGVYLENHNGEFDALSIYLGMKEEYAERVQKCTCMTGTAYIKENQLCFVIEFDHFNEKESLKPLCIPIEITNDLVQFLKRKIQNNFNRIKLHILDENTRKCVSCKELFSDDTNVAIFKKILYDINLVK